MKNKSFHIFLSILATLGILISETICGTGNCQLVDKNNKTISDDQLSRGLDLEPISDVQEEDTVIYNTTILNHDDIITDVYNNDQERTRYVSAEVDYHTPKPDNIYIYVVGKFNDYENEQTSTVLSVRVVIDCVNGYQREIKLRIPIIDSNNHDPEFLDNSYNFTLPMPMPKGTIIGKITMRDVDLTNEQVILRFDENEHSKGRFLISPPERDPQNKKKYFSHIISASTIDLEDDVPFTLIATDSGTPPRTINTTGRIIINRKNSYPRFAHPLYTANLTKIDYKKSGNVSVKFVEGNITITRGYQGFNNITIKGCSDENAKHFKLTHTGSLSDDGLVTFVQLGNLTEEFLKQKVINVVLSASWNYVEATTVLQILLPEITDDTKPEIACQTTENENTSVGANNKNAYVATIILSIVCIGLMTCIVFLVLKKEMCRVCL